MRDDDRGAFADIMAGLAENYGQSVTARGAALRFESLRQFEIEDIRRAALSLMAQRKYTTMPTVADFLDHLGGGSAEDKAELAVGKILRAVGEVGSYASVVFDDPVTMAVIEGAYGGWPQLCAACTSAEIKFMRRELAKTYAAYARQGARRFGRLSGVVENANGSAGFLDQIPPPVLVGDVQKAEAVQAEGERLAALDEGGAGRTMEFVSAGALRALPYDAAG